MLVYKKFEGEKVLLFLEVYDNHESFTMEYLHFIAYFQGCTINHEKFYKYHQLIILRNFFPLKKLFTYTICNIIELGYF